MGQKVKDASEQHVARDECHHYWIIESADGPTSMGLCKFCGAEKEFFNSLPDFSGVKRHTNPFTLPELSEVEFDKKQNNS